MKDEVKVLREMEGSRVGEKCQIKGCIMFKKCGDQYPF